MKKSEWKRYLLLAALLASVCVGAVELWVCAYQAPEVYAAITAPLRSAVRQAEEAGEETSGRAALCLRAVNVLSQVISDAGQLQREWSQRSLEAEVEALERLAAMRGDIGGMGEA